MVPKGITVQPGDTWCYHDTDYHIDKVEFSMDNPKVYMSRYPSQKRRSNTILLHETKNQKREINNSRGSSVAYGV